MKIATSTICYRERRFIEPFLKHIPDWVDKKLVLASTKPWQGEEEPDDGTADKARELGAEVIEYYWPTEEEQRNAGQEYLSDYDWIIVLDPDEYFADIDWEILHDYIKLNPQSYAQVCSVQTTYWKTGFKIDPPEEYRQIILVKPQVKFVDKRVVDQPWSVAPVNLHHMSWARTDKECLSKISHYAHAHELLPNWYEDVWLADKRDNVHPLTPEALKKVVPAKLPKELERLNLWPKTKTK